MSSQNGQVQINVPIFKIIDDLYFQPQLLLGVDTSEYRPDDPGAKRSRKVTFYLGSHLIILRDKRADDFVSWWRRFTGEAQIIAPPPAAFPTGFFKN
jgi:hypothetical protein